MDRSRNRLFLSSTGHRTSSGGGMFGIQQNLKMLQKSSKLKIVEQPEDSDNNNEHEHKMGLMNGTNNNGDHHDGKNEVEYEDDGNYNGQDGNEEEEEDGREHQDLEGGGDEEPVGEQTYDEDEEEYAQQLLAHQYQQQQLMMGNGGGGEMEEEEEEEEQPEQQNYGDEEDEYDYPDISEFVQTEFEGECEDDEEDRGLPPADMRSMPQAGYYDPADEEGQEETTNSLLQSLPPGTFIQQTTKRSHSSSPSSSSARTSTTLNNLLLLRNNTSSTSRKNAAAAQALSNALMLMEQQSQLDDENDDQQDYYGSNGVPLSLIVQQQAQVKRQQMNKSRSYRPQPLSTSALLEQLQSPAYSKPNILSRKLMGGSNGVQNLSRADTFQSGARPPPRLQLRPNGNGQRAIQQQAQQISLESLLRKASNSSKPMPRLQTLSPSKSSSPRSQSYIVDGRKLSFKTAANNQMRQQKSPTRSLESLMLSHQKSTQLQQQLASGRMRGDGIMVGNLHIRQVSQPVVRSNGNSLLRGSITGQASGQKNVQRCHVCRKTFATNQVLQRHVASVHGIVFGDIDVGKLSGSVAQLQQQQQQQQQQSQQQKGDQASNANGSGSNGAHRCRVCYRTFGNLESLRAHALNHEGEFKCRACRRGFPSWEILEQHEATHKKYECRWCEKYFMNSGNLKAHERIHTGERPYKCADCQKGFKQLGGLQYHLKTNPTHRPQKYKLEDQDSSPPNQQQSNSPQDYSTSSSLLLQNDMYAEDGSGDGEGVYMEDDDQDGGYLDLATAAASM